MTKLIWQNVGCVVGKTPVAFSPDNNTLIARSIDPDLLAFKFWNIPQGIEFVRFQFINTSSSSFYDFGGYPDKALAISPDAQKIAIYSQFTVELWNLSNGQFLDHLHLPDYSEMYCPVTNYISNGKLICWDDGADTLRIWGFRPNRGSSCLYLEKVYKNFPDLQIPFPVLNCLYKDNLFLVMDEILLTTLLIKGDEHHNEGHFYCELDVQVVREIKIDTVVPTCLTISQTGSFLVVGYSDGIIRLYDANTGELIRYFSKHSSSVKSVAISPDCRNIASVGETVDSETSIKVWNTVTGELNANLTGSGSAITSLLFSPDSTKLAASSDSQVTLFALRNELPERTYSINDDHLANDEFF